MIFPCIRNAGNGLLMVSIVVNSKYKMIMALDTGATHTTIDSNALYLSGYSFKDSTDTAAIETANGVIETEIFQLKNFSSLGIKKENFEVQVYDFLSHGIFSNYNGLLGLDFLEGKKFCIDLAKNEIEIY